METEIKDEKLLADYVGHSILLTQITTLPSSTFREVSKITEEQEQEILRRMKGDNHGDTSGK